MLQFTIFRIKLTISRQNQRSSSIEFKNHFSNTTPHLIVSCKLKALYLIMKGVKMLKMLKIMNCIKMRHPAHKNSNISSQKLAERNIEY